MYLIVQAQVQIQDVHHTNCVMVRNDICQLKEFGSEFVCTCAKTRKKRDPKGEHGLGYGENTKGYRIYLTEKKIIDVTKDIIIIEKTGEEKHNIVEDGQVKNKIGTLVN